MSNGEFVRLRADLDRALTRICPAWLVDRKDDLVQTAMAALLEKKDRGGEVDRPRSSSYYRRKAYWLLVDEIRRHRRMRETALEDSGMAVDGTSSRVSPERESLSREVGQAIEACLQEMVRPRRLAVVLHLQGHTVREAAGILSWGRKRTDNLVYRGLANLRSCLVRKGFEP